MTSPAADRNRPPVTAESLRLEVEQKLRSRHICADPGAAARLGESVYLPRLKGMAAEIERLREEVAAVRALAVMGGVPLAELERVRTEARAGKSGSKGGKP